MAKPEIEPESDGTTPPKSPSSSAESPGVSCGVPSSGLKALMTSRESEPRLSGEDFVEMGREIEEREEAEVEAARKRRWEEYRAKPRLDRVDRIGSTVAKKEDNYGDWIDVVDMARGMLKDMKQQPTRYTRAQMMMVQVTIAVITDPETKSDKRAAAAKDMIKMFGAFSQKRKDDPRLPDKDLLDDEEKEVQGASTRELLRRVDQQKES